MAMKDEQLNCYTGLVSFQHGMSLKRSPESTGNFAKDILAIVNGSYKQVLYSVRTRTAGETAHRHGSNLLTVKFRWENFVWRVLLF